MAIQQIPLTYESKDYTLYQGIDEEGEAVDYIDQVEPDETGLSVRFEPDETTIKRGQKGSVAYIITKYKRVLVGPNGTNIPGTETYLYLNANGQDKKFFIAYHGGPIMMSEINGLVRGPWGFNKRPVFDTRTGAVIEYTEEQKAEAPTNDYHPIPEPIEPNEPAPDPVNP